MNIANTMFCERKLFCVNGIASVAFSRHNNPLINDWAVWMMHVALSASFGFSHLMFIVM